VEGKIRFLADESCDFAVVRSLRSAGYDVVAVTESFPSATDKEVLGVAVEEDRILITEDSDFGEWVLIHREKINGPLSAVEEFLSENPHFQVDPHRERYILTYNPKGFLKRVSFRRIQMKNCGVFY